jgi:hypothetical protein
VVVMMMMMMFVSAEYAALDWTRHERRAALNKAVRERREYVLPARFDDTPLPGLLPDVSYVEVSTKTSQQSASWPTSQPARQPTALGSDTGGNDARRDRAGVDVDRPGVRACPQRVRDHRCPYRRRTQKDNFRRWPAGRAGRAAGSGSQGWGYCGPAGW